MIIDNCKRYKGTIRSLLNNGLLLLLHYPVQLICKNLFGKKLILRHIYIFIYNEYLKLISKGSQETTNHSCMSKLFMSTF